MAGFEKLLFCSKNAQPAIATKNSCLHCKNCKNGMEICESSSFFQEQQYRLFLKVRSGHSGLSMGLVKKSPLYLQNHLDNSEVILHREGN